MSLLMIRVTRLDGNLAGCSVLCNGEHVGESSWYYEQWNDHWTYCGEGWADEIGYDILAALTYKR